MLPGVGRTPQLETPDNVYRRRPGLAGEDHSRHTLKIAGGTEMQQLTGMDASFLALETANATGHVGGLSVLDPSTASRAARPWPGSPG